MSILSAQAPISPVPRPVSPTSMPAVDEGFAGVALIVVVLFSVVGAVLAVRLGVFRKEKVIGPKRIPDQGGAGALLFILFITLCVWLSSQWVYLAYKQAQWQRAGIKDAHKNLEALLGPKDYAVLSTIPPVIGFLVMLVANKLVRRRALDDLGLSPRKLGRGILLGIVGFLVIGPALVWTMPITELFYHIIHYQHPQEHPLLTSLGTARTQWAEVLILLGATVCAPLFEEFLFRGHVQTLLRHLAMRMSARSAPSIIPMNSPPLVFPVPQINFGDGPAWPLRPPVPPYSDQQLQPEPPPLRPAAWHSWLAIILTSLFFATLHPAWSAPPIFVLSVGLGYLYERTGNLWAPITVHMLFNSLETVQYYFLFMRGH